MADQYVPGQPPQIPTKVKAWVGFGASLIMGNVAVVTASLADGQISGQEWWGIGVAVAGSVFTGLGVWAAPRYKA